MEKSFEDDLSVIFDSIPEKRQTLLFSATLTDNLNRLKDLSSSTPFWWEAPTESANKMILNFLHVTHVVYDVMCFNTANLKHRKYLIVFNDIDVPLIH